MPVRIPCTAFDSMFLPALVLVARQSNTAGVENGGGASSRKATHESREHRTISGIAKPSMIPFKVSSLGQSKKTCTGANSTRVQRSLSTLLHAVCIADHVDRLESEICIFLIVTDCLHKSQRKRQRAVAAYFAQDTHINRAAPARHN